MNEQIVSDHPLTEELEQPKAPTSGLLGWINNHNHQIGSAVLSIFTIIFLIAALQLPIGNLHRPGPGLWPIIIASVTTVLGIVEILVAKEDEENFTWSGITRAAILVATLLIYPVLYPFIGFLIPAALIIVIMMVVLYDQSWTRSLIVAVLTSGSVYFVFAELLDVRLVAL